MDLTEGFQGNYEILLDYYTTKSDFKKHQELAENPQNGKKKIQGGDAVWFACVPYPFAQVAGEDEVAGEGVGERRVEVEHFEESVSVNDVQIAVG